MNKSFAKLLRIFTIETKDMKPFLKREMKKYPEMTKGHFGKDFLYYKGTLPVLLVAHMDTVHREIATVDSIAIYKDKVTAPFTGLGADDRLGIFGILEMLERGHRPHIVFTDKEEIGGIGAKEFASFIRRYPKLAPQVNFMVELDRMNKNDAAMYECGNESFIAFLSLFGYEKARGTYTDICDIMPALDRAGTNISVGYYRQHSDSEYFVISEYYQNMDRLEGILNNAEGQPAFKFQKKSNNYGYQQSYRRNRDRDTDIDTSSLRDFDFESEDPFGTMNLFKDINSDKNGITLITHKPEPALNGDGEIIEHMSRCDNCMSLFPEDELKFIDGDFYCEECVTYSVPYYKTRGL